MSWFYWYPWTQFRHWFKKKKWVGRTISNYFTIWTISEEKAVGKRKYSKALIIPLSPSNLYPFKLPNLKVSSPRESNLFLWLCWGASSLLPTPFSLTVGTFHPFPLQTQHVGLRLSPQALTVGNTFLFSLNVHLKLLPLHYVIQAFSLKNIWKMKTNRRKQSHLRFHSLKKPCQNFYVFSYKFFHAFKKYRYLKNIVVTIQHTTFYILLFKLDVVREEK